MKKAQKLAKHFDEDEMNFEYGFFYCSILDGYLRGWFYRDKMNRMNYFLGKSITEIQEQPFWAMKKLFGRDSF